MPSPSMASILGREPGAMGGSNTVASVQVPPLPLGDKIWEWDHNEFAMVSMIQKFNRVPMKGIGGSHIEDRGFPHWVRHTGADETAGSESTTLGSDITGWDRLNIYDLVFNTRTHEMMLITGLTSASDIDVIRGASIGSHTSPMKNGDTLLRFSSQKEEGGVARDAMSSLKESVTWKAGIWRHSTELTTDTLATEMYGASGAGGQNERLYQLKKWRREHKREIAQHFLLGGTSGDYQSATSPTAGYGHQFSNGLMGIVRSWVMDCNGSLSWDVLKSWAMGPLQYIPQDRTPFLICGQKIIDIVTSYGNDVIRITPDQKYWGWEFDEIRIGSKKIGLMHEPLFDEDPLLSGMAFLGTPEHVMWHPVIGNSENLDTKLHMNIKRHNNPELVKDEFVTHGGFHLFIEPSWGWLYGA